MREERAPRSSPLGVVPLARPDRSFRPREPVAPHAGSRLHYSANPLYGSGLRDEFAKRGRSPTYYTFDVGFEQYFHVPHFGVAKARFDIVNLTDRVYELRDGSGIGVGAPQFGQRRGIYGGISIDFGPQPAAKEIALASEDGRTMASSNSTSRGRTLCRVMFVPKTTMMPSR